MSSVRPSRIRAYQFEHQRLHAVRLFEAVDRGDVRVVERGEHLRFPLEARQAIRVQREGLGQDFQRDVASELRIPRPVHLAHPARAEQVQNLVRAETCAGSESHVEPDARDGRLSRALYERTPTVASGIDSIETQARKD
jgi:hypothetical protein